jgi:hypothetical protein
MYKKNKLNIPVVNFNKMSIQKFHELFGYNNYNIIYNNYNKYLNRTRLINSNRYGIDINIKYEK